MIAQATVFTVETTPSHLASPIGQSHQRTISQNHQKFLPRLQEDDLANQFRHVELNDGAKTTNIDKSPQQSRRPIVYFSTEFDVIATEDEEWEPPVRREWDEWEDKDKANAQVYWTRERLLKRTI